MQSSTKSEVKKGRPPSHDREVALGAMAETFLLYGWGSTTLDDISSATGMQRPSLFAAFGNKKSMYLHALHWYADKMLRMVEVELARPVSLRECLSQALRRIVGTYDANPAKGCLVFCTAPAAAAQDADVASFLKSLTQQMQQLWLTRLHRAEDENDAPAGDIVTTAYLLSALVQACAIHARMGVPVGDLLVMVDAVLDQLLLTQSRTHPKQKKYLSRKN